MTAFAWEVTLQREAGVRRLLDVRPFRLPMLDFEASSYHKVVKIKWKRMRSGGPNMMQPPLQPFFDVFVPNSTNPEIPSEPVLMPPLLNHREILAIRDTPYESPRFPCHMQQVEHGVGTTSFCVKKRKTPEQQLRTKLLVLASQALKGGNKNITHKQYKEQNISE